MSGAETPILLALAVGALVTYAWRAAGVVLSGRVSAQGAAVEWVGCVAYALLAGLVARMAVLPLGGLAEVEGWARALAVGAGVLAFALGRRNVAVGVLAGVSALALLSAAAG